MLSQRVWRTRWTVTHRWNSDVIESFHFYFYITQNSPKFRRQCVQPNLPISHNDKRKSDVACEHISETNSVLCCRQCGMYIKQWIFQRRDQHFIRFRVSDWFLNILVKTERLYRVAQKQTSFLYALTLSNIIHFSKLFHYQNRAKLYNNTITKDPTIPQVCVAARFCENSLLQNYDTVNFVRCLCGILFSV